MNGCFSENELYFNIVIGGEDVNGWYNIGNFIYSRNRYGVRKS